MQQKANERCLQKCRYSWRMGSIFLVCLIFHPKKKGKKAVPLMCWRLKGISRHSDKAFSFWTFVMNRDAFLSLCLHVTSLVPDCRKNVRLHTTCNYRYKNYQSCHQGKTHLKMRIVILFWLLAQPKYLLTRYWKLIKCTRNDIYSSDFWDE